MQGQPLRSFFVYIIQCVDGTFYTGMTNHLLRRMKEHQRGRGAKYLRSRTPLLLVYWEECATHKEAFRRELAIKKLKRQKKEELVLTSFNFKREV